MSRQSVLCYSRRASGDMRGSRRPPDFAHPLRRRIFIAACNAANTRQPAEYQIDRRGGGVLPDRRDATFVKNAFERLSALPRALSPDCAVRPPPAPFPPGGRRTLFDNAARAFADISNEPESPLSRVSEEHPMHAPLSISEQSVWPYISTGHLPQSEMVQKLVSEAHARFKSHAEGQNSHVYPALARVPRDLFGI